MPGGPAARTGAQRSRRGPGVAGAAARGGQRDPAGGAARAGRCGCLRGPARRRRVAGARRPGRWRRAGRPARRPAWPCSRRRSARPGGRPRRRRAPAPGRRPGRPRPPAGRRPARPGTRRTAVRCPGRWPTRRAGCRVGGPGRCVRGEPLRGGRAERGERDVELGGQVRDVRAFQAGVMNRGDAFCAAAAAAAGPVLANREQFQGVGQLGQVTDPVQAVRAGQRLPRAVARGQRARVRRDQVRAGRGQAHAEQDDRDVFGEGGGEDRPAARRGP